MKVRPAERRFDIFGRPCLAGVHPFARYPSAEANHGTSGNRSAMLTANLPITDRRFGGTRYCCHATAGAARLEREALNDRFANQHSARRFTKPKAERFGQDPSPRGRRAKSRVLRQL